MKISIGILSSVMSLLFFSAGCVSMTGGDYSVGTEYHGFKLLEKRFVPELNAECLYFEHLKSGARLVKVRADDINKTFTIVFKTMPDSDCGTAHIVEHSVLNGSKNFPVRSPFEELAKGSLNTYLNAWTASDCTAYPLASMNEKDYFNLMHVYLDAVFYPKIYQEPRIFLQEGWHHELTGENAPVTIKGVVYNEMKGTFSSPGALMHNLTYKELFPDNSYGFFSAGNPSAIPNLTYEKFLEFHRRHYRPDNSLILLYGNVDLEKELAFIDDKYLSALEMTSGMVSTPLQKPFDKMKECTASYPVPEGGITQDQTFLSISFVAGSGGDRTLVMGLGLLGDLLVNQEAAPLRQALQEAGIGKESYAYCNDSQQNIFTIVAKNANPGDKDRFKDIVFKVLSEAATKGFDNAILEGVVNRLEFDLRKDDDAFKGLGCTGKAISGWIYSGNPMANLGFETALAEIKKGPPNACLKEIIRKYLLGNPHSLLFVLQPEPGLEKKEAMKTQEKLAYFKAGLSVDLVKSLVKETQSLMEYQKSEDSPEALACIPMLGISDINPKAEWFASSAEEVAGVTLLHHEEFTNNIVYANFYFDMRVLPERLIPYAALLSNVLGSMGTEKHNYKDLDNQLNIHTGGFGTGISNFLEKRDDTRSVPKFNVSCKSLNIKMDKLLELTGEIVNRTKYGDKERLKIILERHQAERDSSVRRGALDCPMTRLLSYYSDAGMFNELTGGLEYYWFLTDLAKNFDSKADEISANLAETASLLFTRENMVISTTCGNDDYYKFKGQLGSFIGKFRSVKPQIVKWDFKLNMKNEGLTSASKVQCIAKGYNFRRLGYQWNGKMYVLKQILSKDWLNNQIRVVGGAYGAGCSFSQAGNTIFFSFSDPNLGKTLETFDETPAYLEQFAPDAKEMTRYIIGTISSIDWPMSPSQKGERAVQYYFQKTELKELQRDRDAILCTTSADIRGMKEMVADILKQDVLCASGGEEKIKSESKLFKSIVNPLR